MMSEATARKCLACGRANSAATDACSSCGSSLDLKLCPACEAINASGAARCHACGKDFGSYPQELAVGESGALVVAESANAPRSGSRAGRHVATLVALLAAVLAWPAYVLFGSGNRAAVPAEDGAVLLQAAATKSPVPSAAATPETKTAPALRPAGSAAAVTHTQSAVPSAPAAAAQARQKALAPVVVAEPPIADAPPVAVTPHARVTHTKAAPAQAPLDAPMPHWATSRGGISGSASAGAGRLPDCDEPIAALGFCNGKATGGK